MAVNDLIAMRPFGEEATQWVEVFLSRDEFVNAHIRARAAGIHMVEVEQGKARPVMLVRSISRWDDPNNMDYHVEYIVRGTAEAIFPPRPFRELEFFDWQVDQAHKAKTRPNTGARVVELAVEALYDHLESEQRELIRLYLIPISIIQEKEGLRHTGPETKDFILRHWPYGDVGALRYFREDVGSPPPSRMTWRPASSRMTRLDTIERRIKLLRGPRAYLGQVAAGEYHRE